MEKQDKKGKMTLDELARRIQDGFLENKAELGQLEGRLNHRIDGLQSQINGIDRRIDDIALNKVGYKELDLILAPIRNKLAL